MRCCATILIIYRDLCKTTILLLPLDRGSKQSTNTDVGFALYA
jgi:hypothetical protein